MGISQEFVTPPFDNLQWGKGEWPRTRCRGHIKFAPNRLTLI